jgi:ribosomal protein L37AE/L43A
MCGGMAGMLGELQVQLKRRILEVRRIAQKIWICGKGRWTADEGMNLRNITGN